MSENVIMNESGQKSHIFRDAVPDCFNENYEEMYEVQQIVGWKTVGRYKYFKVRWKGYTENDDTWEPEQQIRKDVPGILKAYIKDNFTDFKVKKKKSDPRDRRILLEQQAMITRQNTDTHSNSSGIQQH